MSVTLQGSATRWMAVFADVGTSLLVVVNGLILFKNNINENQRYFIALNSD